MTEQTVAEILRKPFPANQIGHLPRGGIQLDYVGHADVTSRLLEADPSWAWEPQARDIDKDVLAAAVATGSPDIVRQVLENAPPKFDADKNGNPVGLWIRLTVGGVTRPGFGSCPSTQGDPEKVLIGDALRNAAMRFGVAVDLWAKGDRADPTRENATAAGGQAARHGRQQSRPAEPPAQPDEALMADWGAKIDAIVTAEDAAKADTELKSVFQAGRMDATTANAIRGAIKKKAASLARPKPVPPAEDIEAAKLAERAAAAKDIAELTAVWADVRDAQKITAPYTHDGQAMTLGQFVQARKAELESADGHAMAGAR